MCHAVTDMGPEEMLLQATKFKAEPRRHSAREAVPEGTICTSKPQR